MNLHKQAFALALMHAADVIQPLLVIPYAARVLHPEQFGRFAYAISIGAIASTIVDYGFHWTGQREAAASRGDRGALATLYFNVLCTKLSIFFAVLLLGLPLSGPMLGLDTPLFLSALIIPAGNMLFPAWLFIGIERAWRAAYPVIISRTVLLLAFFVAVRTPADTMLATMLQGASPLLAAIVSIPYVYPYLRRAYLQKHATRGPAVVRLQLLDGWRAFMFALVERTVTTVPIPLVTYFGGYVDAGQYSIAEKFVSATRPFFRIIVETFLPRVAYHAKHSPEEGMVLIQSVFYTLSVGASLSLFLYFAAPLIIVLVFGSEFSGAIPLVRLMSAVPLLLNLNMLTSQLYMFTFGHERAWSYLTASSLVVFFGTFWLAMTFGLSAPYAVAVAIVARETLVVLVSSAYYIQHRAFQRTIRSSPTITLSSRKISAATDTQSVRFEDG